MRVTCACLHSHKLPIMNTGYCYPGKGVSDSEYRQRGKDLNQKLAKCWCLFELRLEKTRIKNRSRAIMGKCSMPLQLRSPLWLSSINLASLPHDWKSAIFAVDAFFLEKVPDTSPADFEIEGTLPTKGHHLLQWRQPWYLNIIGRSFALSGTYVLAELCI